MGRHASRILSSDCTQHNQNLQEDVYDKFSLLIEILGSLA